METECEKLTAAGFKDVRISSGGIRGWVQARGVTAGVSKPEEALLLTQAELSAGRFNSGWLKVRVRRAGEAALHQDILDGVVMEWNGSGNSLAQAAAALVKGNPESRQVLRYDQNGAFPSGDLSNLVKLSFPVFLLRGGLKPWQELIVLTIGRTGGRKMTLSSVLPANVRMSAIAARNTGRCGGGGKK